MRETRIARDGYLFTEIADVKTEERTWAKVKDCTDFSKYHEVPISQYEEWQQKMVDYEEDFELA